jgi:phenylpyruvate tautomerase PptA (4-oxalocrotonate tautomerase family)
MMPVVTIEVRRTYTRSEEIGIIDAVHSALMEGLKIPEWDKTIRFISHEPHRFTSAPGKGERYTLITIDLFAGRSLAAKKKLYSAIVRNLDALRIPPDHVKVALREIPRENWGIGGLAASEIEIGFEIKV